MQGKGPVSAEDVVRRHFRRIYGFCRSLLWNEADVEDACQEVCLQIARRENQLEEIEKMGAWVLKIALLTCLALRRKRGRHQRLESESEIDAPVEVGPPISSSDELSKIRGAMKELPARYQAVLNLHYQQSLSHEQMAEVLGVSRGALRVLLHRAVARLREQVRKV